MSKTESPTYLWFDSKVMDYLRRRLQSSRVRAIAVTATVAVASGVLVWGLLAEDSGFRPTAPAGLIAGVAVVAGAWTLPTRGFAFFLAVASIGTAAALLAMPAGEGCDLPVAEFVAHTFEGAAGPHDHDRCQLESDRRSIAGLTLGIAGGVAVALLLGRSRTPRPRARSGV